VLINHVKKILILIDDETQLRFVVLNISNNNEFVYSMKMFFFSSIKIISSFVNYVTYSASHDKYHEKYDIEFILR
jgi:hypothetical protein